MRLFIGDDWTEQHHDVELMDAIGRVLAKARLPEGVGGMTRLHEMIAAQVSSACEEVDVVVGIETDRGPWVRTLVAAGYASAVARWYTDYGRWGTCGNAHGKGHWAYCNKNFAEGAKIYFRASQYDGDTGQYVYGESALAWSII